MALRHVAILVQQSRALDTNGTTSVVILVLGIKRCERDAPLIWSYILLFPASVPRVIPRVILPEVHSPGKAAEVVYFSGGRA